MAAGGIGWRTAMLAILVGALTGCGGQAPSVSSAAAPSAAPPSAAPSSPGDATEASITQTESSCSLDGIHEPIEAGDISIMGINETPGRAAFDLFRIGPDGSFQAFAEHVEEERSRAEQGEPFAGPPPWADHVAGSDLIDAGGTEIMTASLEDGTYAVVCLWKFEQVTSDPVRPFALVGPIEVGSTIAALCLTSEPTCEGPLEPGLHRATRIATPFSYVVPEGWAKAYEDVGATIIDRLPADGTPTSGADAPTAEFEPGGYLLVVVDPMVVRQDPCTRNPEPGVGRSPDDIVGWLSSHPGLDVSERFELEVGSRAAIGVDIAKREGWVPQCDEGVSLFVHELTEGLWWWIDDRTAERIVLVGLADERVALIVFDALDAEFADAVQEAMPVIESIRFDG